MNCPSCGHENMEGNDRCENCLAPFRDLDVPRADSAEGLARSVMEDNLSQLDHDDTITVSPDTPASEVARLMKHGNSGCALILDGKKLVGIFTEHDVLLKMTPVSEAVGRSAEVYAGSAGVPPANEREARTIRTGSGPGSPHGQPEWGGGSDRVADAREVDNKTAKPRVPALQIPVSELMSPNPEALHERDSVAEAVNKMSLGRYRHIPFLKSDGTYAVASIKSVLKYIAQEDW